jgi:hypothetical protein
LEYISPSLEEERRREDEGRGEKGREGEEKRRRNVQNREEF